MLSETPAATRTTALHFPHALLAEGWAADVRIEIAPDGRIAAITAGTGADGAERQAGIAVPGLGNLHSHAFQRAMAGLTECAGPTPDSFWTWRQLMYRFLERLAPDHLEAFAALAYAEMLEAGFTAVAEFHYLHHAPDGRPYDDIGEMSARIVAAAATTGIGLTLLPVLYTQGGFGGQPPTDAQRRFVNTPERFLQLLERTRALAVTLPHAVVGIAPHSLRAVDPAALAAVVESVSDGPIHLHISEQLKEVDDCLAWSGRRPVEWLLDHHAVGSRWCLVHATHMTECEAIQLANSAAVAGLCPITEANLGDGLFPLPAFRAAGGRFGIGSDSNILISAAAELQLLEYGQRLLTRGRNIVATPRASTGRTLFDHALQGGGQALGRPLVGLVPGAPADIVMLDPSHPALIARAGDAWLDGWIFAASAGLVREVWAAGRHVVTAGRHRALAGLRARYEAALRDVMARAP